jgi:hypothetical protein
MSGNKRLAQIARADKKWGEMTVQILGPHSMVGWKLSDADWEVVMHRRFLADRRNGLKVKKLSQKTRKSAYQAAYWAKNRERIRVHRAKQKGDRS